MRQKKLLSINLFGPFLMVIVIVIFGSFFAANSVFAAHTPAVCVTNTMKSGTFCNWNDGNSWCGSNTLTCQLEPDSAATPPGGVSGGTWNFCNSCSWVLSCNGGYTKCAGNNTCIATQACLAGQTFDACSNSCIGTAAILKLAYDSAAGTYLTNSANPVITVLSTGLVGIGTTTPGKLLDVNGQAIFRNFAYGTSPVSTDLLALTTVEYVNGKTGGSGGVGAGTSGQTLRHDGTGWVANSTLFNDGTNVGIGTTVPNYKLDVVGALRSTLASSAIIIANYDANNRMEMSANGFNLVGGNDFTIQQAGGTAQVTINHTTGNVGIGTTGPGKKLEVNGVVLVNQTTVGGDTWTEGIRINRATVPTQYTILNHQGGGTTLTSIVEGGGADGSMTFARHNAGSGTPKVSMSIDSNGNVGIGTTSPITKLQIDHDGASTHGHVLRLFQSAIGNSDGPRIEFRKTMTTSKSWDIGVLNGVNVADFAISEDAGSGIGFGTPRFTVQAGGNVGIGTTGPGKLLEVNGQAKFNSFAYGTTPVNTDLLALATVEYVNGITSGSYLPLAGGTMTGSIAMGNNNISNVNTLTVTKINATTIDPLYSLNGVNYATFAASIAGGVKEECLGKIKINRLAGREYESVIDFSNIAQGSDLWVWRQVVDFNFDNVEVSITPYGKFAQVYYLIEGNKLIFRADRPVEVSYRLTGRRFDWRQWPTKPLDQSETGVFVNIIN